MTKIHQLLALLPTVAGEENRWFTKGYQRAQKTALFGGLSRTYKPDADDGDKYPAESVKVQETTGALLEGPFRTAFSKLFDVQYQLDEANTRAKADVKIGERVLIKDAPVTYLMWLEKQVVHMRTFVEALPVLDPSKNWAWDKIRGTYVSDEVQTAKEKRTPKPFVKYEATKEHPAQVEVFNDTVKVGNWTLIEFSGAMPAEDKRLMLERLTNLTVAVKMARETANQADVQDVTGQGQAIFGYVLGNP